MEDKSYERYWDKIRGLYNKVSEIRKKHPGEGCSIDFTKDQVEWLITAIGTAIQKESVDKVHADYWNKHIWRPDA